MPIKEKRKSVRKGGDSSVGEKKLIERDHGCSAEEKGRTGWIDISPAAEGNEISHEPPCNFPFLLSLPPREKKGKGKILVGYKKFVASKISHILLDHRY